MTKRYVFGLVVLVFFFFGVVSAAAVDTEALNRLADIRGRMANAMDNEDYDEALKISLEVEKFGIDPEELFAGEYEDASEEVKKGRDDYCYVLWLRGWIYDVVYHDPKKAATGYEMVYRYQYDPSHSVFTHFADVLWNLGKHEQAKQVLHNGITRLSESTHPHIYFNLGWYYYLDGEYEVTVLCGEESYKIDPELAGTLFNAATALFVMGKNEEALGWFGLGLSALHADEEKNRGITAAIIEDFQNIEARYPKNNGIKTALSVLYIIEGKEEQVKHRLPALVKEETQLPYLLTYLTNEQPPEFYWPIIKTAAMVGEKAFRDDLFSLLFFGVNDKETLVKWVVHIEEHSTVSRVIKVQGQSPFTEEWIASMTEGIEAIRKGYGYGESKLTAIIAEA